MENTFLTPSELDRLLRLPRGRSRRMARRNLIPFLSLPGGEIRFDRAEIERWLRAKLTPEGECRGA